MGRIGLNSFARQPPGTVPKADMRREAFEAMLDEVGRSVREFVDNPTSKERFRSLIKSGTFRELLREQIADPVALLYLAQQSQLHPNNFLKIPLVVTAGTSKLVVHKWSDEPGADPDLHNHRWNFVSTVLRGRLSATTFSALDDLEGHYEEFAYGSATSQAFYPLTPVGRVSLSQSGRTSASAGEYYAQDHEIIHGAASVMPDTVTLIVQAPESSSECRVFRPFGTSETAPPIINPEPDAVRSTLTDVLALLSIPND